MGVGTTYFDPEASGPAVFLGPTEAQIMELIWKNGPVTVKRALFLLEGVSRPAYTTVMTVMSRLAGKGLLIREKDGRNFVYQAAVGRKEFLGGRVRLVNACLKKNFASYLKQ